MWMALHPLRSGVISLPLTQANPVTWCDQYNVAELTFVLGLPSPRLKGTCSFCFCLLRSPLPCTEVQAGLLEKPRDPGGSTAIMDFPAPAKPPAEWPQPHHVQQRQNQACRTLTKCRNVLCFKALNFGVICYAASGKCFVFVSSGFWVFLVYSRWVLDKFLMTLYHPCHLLSSHTTLSTWLTPTGLNPGPPPQRSPPWPPWLT